LTKIAPAKITFFNAVSDPNGSIHGSFGSGQDFGVKMTTEPAAGVFFMGRGITELQPVQFKWIRAFGNDGGSVFAINALQCADGNDLSISFCNGEHLSAWNVPN